MDEPQILTHDIFCANADGHLLISPPSTPPSPESHEPEVFSPNESILTSITDYELDECTPLVEQNEEEVYRASTSRTSILLRSSVGTLATDTFENAQSMPPAGNNETLQLLQTWETSVPNYHRPDVRHSFSLRPQLDFLAKGQAHSSTVRTRGICATWRVDELGSFPQSLTELAGHGTDAPAAAQSPRSTTGLRGGIGGSTLDHESLLREVLSNQLPPSVQEVLLQDEFRCVATTKSQNKRCKRKLPTPDIQSALDQLGTVSTSTLESLRQMTTRLVPLLFCKQHQRIVAESLTAWVKSHPSAEHSGPTSIPSDRGSSVPQLPDFIPYIPKAYAGKTIQQQLEQLITTPLTPGDITRTGVIYLFQCVGKFGFVKIGYAREVTARLQKWERQCGRKLSSYFPQTEEDNQPVQHVYRVEQLIHAELSEYRRKEPRCPEPKCGQAHIEWFEVPEQNAVSVVRKWMTWMRQCPYVRKDGGSSWVLDETRVGSIKELCSPLVILPNTTPVRALGSTRDASRRQSGRQRRRPVRYS